MQLIISMSVTVDGFTPETKTIKISNGKTTLNLPVHGIPIKDYDELMEKVKKYAEDLSKDPLTEVQDESSKSSETNPQTQG